MKPIFPGVSLALFSLAVFCCLFYSAASAKDNDLVTADILASLEKKYTGKSFEANFKQVSTLAALDITEEASGKAFFSHPGKMRWQYLSPEKHEIITNGKTLWIYRPDENQVMQGDASSFFAAGAGGAFLSDISLVRKNYDIRLKGVTADHAEIELVPLKKIPDIALIVIRISQKNSEIQKVITANAYDDTTVFEFTHIRFKKILPAFFEFNPPEGLNIIEMD